MLKLADQRNCQDSLAIVFAKVMAQAEPLGIRNVGLADLKHKYRNTVLKKVVEYVESALLHFQCMFLLKETPAPLWHACWTALFGINEQTVSTLKCELFWKWPANQLFVNLYRAKTVTAGADTLVGCVHTGKRAALIFEGLHYPEAQSNNT